MANARELALQTLTDILINGAYSNHALNEQIEKSDLTIQDKNFMTELVYGTLQHQQLYSTAYDSFALSQPRCRFEEPVYLCFLA